MRGWNGSSLIAKSRPRLTFRFCNIIRGMSTIGNPLPYINENDMEIDNDTDMNALPTVDDGERVHDNAATLDSLRTHMPSA